MWCLEGEECAARKFKDRDEWQWILQKWEEEVEVGKILQPTQSHAETTPSSLCALPPTSPHVDGNSSLPAIASPNASPASPPLAMEELYVPPTPCSNTTQPSQTRMVNMRHVCGDDIVAAMCHALIDGQGCPTALLRDVESLLRDHWERPLGVIIPSSGSQLYKLEACHLRDGYTDSYVTNNAEIVVYYWWLTKTALCAYWDVMGVVWVVCDSLWNASSAPWDNRQVLAQSWAHRTLEAAYH